MSPQQPRRPKPVNRQSEVPSATSSVALTYLTDAILRYIEQAWQATAAGDNAAAQDEWGDGEWEEAEGAEYECVACQKTFKSEQAWTNHEQSKKHLKEIML